MLCSQASRFSLAWAYRNTPVGMSIAAEGGSTIFMRISFEGKTFVDLMCSAAQGFFTVVPEEHLWKDPTEIMPRLWNHHGSPGTYKDNSMFGMLVYLTKRRAYGWSLLPILIARYNLMITE